MTQQKLYTEEQVRDMLHEMKFKHNLTDEHIEYWIEDMTPIELPSDEEIDKEASDFGKKYRATTYEISAHVIGAKWMRDKILDK